MENENGLKPEEVKLDVEPEVIEKPTEDDKVESKNPEMETERSKDIHGGFLIFLTFGFYSYTVISAIIERVLTNIRDTPVK